MHLFKSYRQNGLGCVTECEAGWRGLSKKKNRRRKKEHHLFHEGQSHQLWNIHQWLGKCDGTVMTDEEATPPTPPHLTNNPPPLSPSGWKHDGHWICITRKMYWFFIWQKEGHKNHITWNCHSSFVHSSVLLMFGSCHKLSLITRYCELQSLSPQRHSHIQPAGLNKTAHIYYIWHTPRSFCFICD